MGYEVRRSAQSDRDLDLIFDHLFRAYLSFGDTIAEANARTVRRVRQIHADMEALGKAPFQGTCERLPLSDIRHVTKNRAVFYFEINEADSTLLVLAIFLSGQDHQSHMIERLTNKTATDS